MNYELRIKNNAGTKKDRGERIHNSLFLIRNSRKSAGFTLFEMIVSLGIFSTAMLILLSSLLSITSAQRRAVAMSTTEDNLRFAIDSISKEIRTGTNYSVTGTTQFSFKRANGDAIVYMLDPDTLSIVKSTGTGSFLPVTGSNVQIKKFNFYVTGAGTSDGLQPQVTIILQAEMEGGRREASVFNVQTTVVQRQIDS